MFGTDAVRCMRRCDQKDYLSLAHFDSGFQDSAGFVWDNAPNALIDTSTKKFGDASLKISSNGWVSTPSPKFASAADDFTIEFYFRVNNVSTTQGFVSIMPSNGAPRWAFYLRGNGSFLSVYNQTDGVLPSVGITVSANTFHHAAFARQNGTIRTFLNGQLSSTVTNTRPVDHSGTHFLGVRDESGLELMGGWIDELRISNYARYTAPFTPPAAPFED